MLSNVMYECIYVGVTAVARLLAQWTSAGSRMCENVVIRPDVV
jgi:hypothetical protein